MEEGILLQRLRLRLGALIVATLLWVGAGCASVSRRDAVVEPALLGSWSLVSWQAWRDDGEAYHPFGEQARGRLTYDANGGMSLQLMRHDRPRFAADDFRRGSPEELEAAFEGFFGYYGSFSVDRGRRTIRHRIEACSYPNWIGETQERRYELAGDRLRLESPPITSDGRASRHLLIFERIAD